MILPQRACLAVIALALLVAPVSARRTRPLACGGGDFAIGATDAAGLAALVGGDVGTFSFGPGSSVALGTCMTTGHVKAKRRATLVKARFAQCGIGVKAKLAVTMPAPDCGTAHGAFKVKGRKRVRFTAVRTTTTTTTLPQAASCGNGIVDPGEMCEGLSGCGPDTRCTASCTCEPEPATPPTSQTLIAAALAAGTIDYSTSLVDRAYALFGDSRLPPEYDGQRWRFEDQGLFLEASGAWGSLTPEARTALTPFLVRPTDPQSIYFPPPASALLIPRATGVRLQEANCPFLSGAAFPDWRSTESGHFVVWSCGGGDLAQDPDAALRTIVSGVAEQAWSAITPEAVAPRPDGFMSGPSPQDRIDVYIVHGATCKDRQGACVPIETDDEGRRPLAAVVPTSPCDGKVNGALTSSAYMLVDADSVTSAPASGPWKFRYVFAHEFFHVVADAMNLEAQGGGCFDVANLNQVPTSWLCEASAEWAAWAFFGDDGPGERTNLFLAFQEYRPPPAVSLLSVDGQRPYEAFLYPFFLQQENGGSRAPFLTMWKSSGPARRPEDLDDRLDQSLPFDGHFRDFTVRNFNKTIELPPSESHYQGQDSAIPANESPNLIEPTLTLAQPGVTVSPGASLQPLTAQYQRFMVTDAVRYVRIDAGPLVNSGFVDLDALANVQGTWKRRKAKGGVLEFCRDDPGDDVQELYLVVTNHDRKRGRTVNGHYDVRMGATCPAGWSGYLKYVYSDGDAGSTTYGSAFYTKDEHFRTEDTWTLGATTPGMPPDSFDTVDAVWTGSINVTALDTYTPIPPNGCVGYETLYSSASYSGSGSGPQQFQVIPSDADPDQVSLSAVFFASQNSIMASGVEERVQCYLGHSTHPLSSNWGESIGQLQSTLPLLVPDPADPDHYAGTVTLTHSVQDGIEVDSHVTDETIEWDLRRRRQATPAAQTRAIDVSSVPSRAR